jgi:hypothetical protein
LWRKGDQSRNSRLCCQGFSIAKLENVPANGKIKFESIEEFSKSARFLFNTGSILRSKSDWTEVVERL